MYFVYIILIIDFVFTRVIMWLKIACFNRNYYAHIFIYSSYFYILALFLNSKEITAHLSQQESEEMISSLTVNTTISTKLERLAGVFNFQRVIEPEYLLNNWSHKLISLVSKTTRIAKQEVIHTLQGNHELLVVFVFWFKLALFSSARMLIFFKIARCWLWQFLMSFYCG